MSLDDRTLELIHGDIDGVIDADGRAELERLSAKDPAVREQLDRMRQLQRTLADVESLEPPIGMKTAIMAGVAEADRARGNASGGFARWFGGLGFRGAALGAAALVVVALAWPFVRDAGVDPAAASGTIGAEALGTPRAADEPHPDEIVSAGIMFDGADGVVEIVPAGAAGRWTASIAVESRRPMRIELDAGEASIVVATVIDGEPDALRDGPDDRLVWSVEGRSEIRVILATESTALLTLHGTRGEAGIGSASVPVGPR